MTDIAADAAAGKALVEQFLQLVFKASWTQAHVCGVQNGAGWGGGPWRTESARIVAGHGCYFSQSLFHDEHRGWASWDALVCVVLDDIGTKVSAGHAMRALGMPAWRIESSPGNWQWGYRLEQPERDRALCDLLFAELLKQGLCDPGAAKTGAIGYRRLPIGRNLKHPGHVISGTLDVEAQSWTVPDMLSALGVAQGTPTRQNRQNRQNSQLNAATSVGARVPVSPDMDPLWRLLDELGVLAGSMSSDGEGHELTGCPWVAEHTGERDTGHATYWPPGTAKGGRGFGAFKCFHGHCNGEGHNGVKRNVHHLRAWAEAQAGKSVAAEAFKDDVGATEADALDQIEAEAQAEAQKTVAGAQDIGVWLAQSVYIQATTGVILPNGAMVSASAFNTTWKAELRPLLTQPGEKDAPILWLIRQPGVVKVHHVVHWYGRPQQFADRGIPVWNTWQDHGRGLGVAPDRAGLWLWLVQHLLSGHAQSGELARDFVHWLAVVVCDPDRTPGWAVVLWSDTEGVGKDLVFVPIQRALGEDAGTIDVQRVLDGRYNPWSAKRFVHGREFSTRGMTRSDRAKVYNAFKRFVDNAQDWVEYTDKYVRSQRVPKRDAYAFTMNDEDGIPLDPSARRAWVVKSKAARLSSDFAKDFIAWLDEDEGVDSVISYLRAVRAAMTDADVSRVMGPAPETADRRAMIRASDVIYAAIEDELPTMPDLVSLSDPPLAQIVQQARELLGHAPQMTVELNVTRALAKAGFQRVSESATWLPNGERRRVWSKTDHERYRQMSGLVLGRTYVEQRGKPGTNVVKLT